MGLTSAMLVGFTGIQSNQYAIDTVGDNVANVNTTAFKNQRAVFETVFYRTLDAGTGPTADQGGTNPQQVGYGSRLAALQRNFEAGSIQPTGTKSDVAIDGNGFLILQTGGGDQVYTRDGALQLDENNTLVSADGSFVQGYAADSEGNVVAGALSNLVVPLGAESDAVPTTTAALEGNLDAGAVIASAPSVSTSAPLVTAGGAATAGTQLTSLVDSDDTALFANGDVLTLRDVQKGGADLPTSQFVVGTDGATVGDLASFLEDKLAIDTGTALPDGSSPGVTIDSTGALVITANPGEPNAISIEASNLRNDTSGILPFTFSSTPAGGSGVTTGFIVYDSLGNPVEVRMRAVLESRSDSGSVWRFWAESNDDSDASPLLGTGTLTFDQNGELVASTGTDLTIDRASSGSVNPLTFSLDVTGVTGLNFGTDDSTLVMATQDGMPGGTLIDYEIDTDGLIVGTFGNGQTRTLGQLALATFRNNEGLVALSDNTYSVGVNSGDPMITAPKEQGAGSIQSNALESSNVELSREFINLITASTGFSAASRVVRSADDMLQELLLLAR
jgi:flagellar hook protein FlgE